MNKPLNYNEPIEIAEGIFWIGYADDSAGLHCNPYIIIEGEEAILIDGGSRSDFSSVMLKILQTGVNPNHINRLLYHHYDPDLCGSIPHFESLIQHEDLKIISHRENNIFIQYYSSAKPKECIETLGWSYTFRTGRRLKFYRTPYAHSTGSFMTLDEKTGTLFSSDIFGSYDRTWELFIDLKQGCKGCRSHETCHMDATTCMVHGIKNFQQRVMPSTAAFKYALKVVREINPTTIAPQHGSIIRGREWIEIVLDHMERIESLGIDLYLEGIGKDEC